MKKLSPILSVGFFLLVLNVPQEIFSQSVGIGTSTPNSSAQLEIKSSTKGLLIPRTSSVTRTAIVNPAKSLFLYDTVTNSFWFYSGTDWIESGRIDPAAVNTFFGFQTGISNTGGVGNTGIGHQALSANTDGAFNTAIGYFSLVANLTGTSNTAVGSSALRLNTTGIENTAVGASALTDNTSGKDNIAIGYNSLNDNTTGNYNTAIGVESMRSSTTGFHNTAAGYRALYNIGNGYNNVAMGSNALLSNVSGNSNVAIGTSSLFSNGSGQYNVAIGDSALYHQSSGTYNIAIGSFALYNGSGTDNIALGENSLGNTTGTANIALGGYTLSATTTGGFNVALGFDALAANIVGNNNVSIGAYSGPNIVGSNNVVLGTGSNVGGPSVSNSVALGPQATVNASNKIRLGSTSTSVIEGQVAYSFPSDGRFKFNVSGEDVKGLDFIMRLHPVNYQFDTRKFDAFLQSNNSNAQKLGDQDYEESSAIIHNGFVAQEVEQAMKESGFNFDGLHTPTNEKDNYSIAYSQFVVPLVKAVQEQQKLIETLQKKNEELEKRITLLENK